MTRAALDAFRHGLAAIIRRWGRAHEMQRESGLPSVEATLQDVRLAFRGLRRAPGFGAVTLLTIALGIGANGAIFSVVDAVVIRPLPYPRADELVGVWGSTQAELVRIRELNRSFRDVAAYQTTSVSLSGGERDPERVAAASVSANLLSTLGVPPLLGQTFTPAADEPSSDRVVLSHGLWQTRYGTDSAILGRRITVEGAPVTVVGVMPADFSFPSRSVRLWTPMTLRRANAGAFWGSGGHHIVARLAPGVTVARAREDVRRVARQIQRENPVWDPGPTYGSDADVVPLQQEMVGSVRPTLLILLAVVGAILLIACANVANLLLVRATARQRELAIRSAVGGGRGRLIRQLLTESLVLAALGGALGLVVARQGLRALVSLMPSDMPRIGEIGVDGRAVAFTAVLTTLTGLAFGLLPAVRATGAALHGMLKEGASGAGHGAGHHRVSGMLVVAQVGLAVILVTAAQLLLRSFWELRRVDPGFESDRILAASVNPPRQRYLDADRQRALYAQLLARVAALPDVQSIAAISQLPLAAPAPGIAVRIEGQFEDLRRTLPMADDHQIITPGYLRTMGIPLLQGRAFTDADREGTPGVALVSASMARQFWRGQNPIGRRIGYPWPSDWLTVVGVVGDVKHDSLSAAGEMAVYRPFAQRPAAAMTLVVRTRSDPLAVTASLRAAIADIDPEIPMSDVSTMKHVVARSIAKPRFTMLLLLLFASVALLLGAVGIYGVMAYAVGQRRQEIGVRMALGASPRDALILVMKRGVVLTGVGVGVGLLGALATTRVLAGLLYGVTPTDPLTFAAVPVVLTLVAVAASYLPARRAARVDPLLAMRGG